MNYLRGAFSAASQYYTSLPPINPSTLTGAIDVIVIERPRNDGEPGTELACSPFHVRFGKWQVLRPGEKKVNVLVNGQPIPFNMKIGEAGEAFFVFETDEDVPDDLLTSPLLEATKVGDESEPRTGRFGAKEVSDDTSSHPGTTESSKKSSAEPTFLDLESGDLPLSRAQSPISSRSPSPSPSSEGSLSNDNRHRHSLPTSISSQSQDASEPPSATTASPSSFLDGKGILSQNALSHVPSAAAAKIMQVGDAIRKGIVRVEGDISNYGEADPVGDGNSSAADGQEEGPSSTPVYGHDVVIDMSGYHSKQPSDEVEPTHSQDDGEVDLEANRSRGLQRSQEKSPRPKSPPLLTEGALAGNGLWNSATLRSPGLVPLSRRRQFAAPEIAISSEQTSPVKVLDAYPFPPPNEVPSFNRSYRVGSEPPETQVPPLSSSAPEYSWEWGGFPQRSPAVEKFSTGRPKQDRATSVPVDLDATSEASSAAVAKAEESPKGFGAGGRLLPSGDDDFTFWVDMEGRQFTFQLSLCGHLDGKDEVADSAKFDDAKVSYTQFVDDPSMSESDNLVIKWANVNISQRDSSPLMSALSLWRESAVRPVRPLSPVANLPKAAASQPTLTHSRGSSWALWWSRSRSERDLLSGPSPPPPHPAGPKPTLLSHNIAPIPEPLEPEKLISPPESPSLQARASESSVSTTSPKKHHVKTLRLTSDQLKELNLKKGANTITFSLTSSGSVACTARIFVWESTDHIVVSDIDGTITKSDALGHVFTMIGRDWTHVGVAKLYTDIAKNGYKIMYLTSRAIGQADSTRDYLKNIKQNNHQLPEGPVIMSPDRLMASLHREVIMRKPEVFKMACLRDIQRLFGTTSKTQFYAGFGNRITDALSYRSVNIPSSRIFTIDSSGEVKMELLELAGYKSSYIHMTDLVDQMFPPVNRKVAAEFTDFNYWRAPVQEFELPNLDPPSPALSARSDTSRLSRLRNFSLGRPSSSQSLSERNRSPESTTSNTQRRNQSSPLASPVLTANDPEEYDDYDSSRSPSRTGYRRDRRLSMPGSIDGRLLDDEGFGEEHEEEGRDHDEEDDDKHSEGDDYYGEGSSEHIHDEESEAAFDDDLLATGEMDDIPFL